MYLVPTDWFMEVATWFVVWTFGPSLVEALTTRRGDNDNNNKNKTKASKTTDITATMPRHTVFGVERDIDIPVELFPTPTELEQHLEGPSVLPGCRHGWYESVYRGAQLHYRYFLPEVQPPKAVVVYAHGIVTHGGKTMILKNGRKLNTSLLSEALLKEGIALYMPDMYGHGYSEGVRFYIPESYEKNLEDLRRFIDLVVVKEQGDTVPLFVMGESYGGCLSLLLARHYQDNPTTAPKNFEALLLPGPAIVADLPPYPVYLALRYVLAPLFPTWKPFFMPNPLPPERIWSDPEVVAARTDPANPDTRIDGSGTGFRLGTAANLVRALQAAEHTAIPGLTVPYCVVHGTDDLGVPVRGSDYLWATALTPEMDRAFLRKDGGKHDMLADPAAEEAMEFFLEYIRRRLARKKTS